MLETDSVWVPWEAYSCSCIRLRAWGWLWQWFCAQNGKSVCMNMWIYVHPAVFRGLTPTEAPLLQVRRRIISQPS